MKHYIKKYIHIAMLLLIIALFFGISVLESCTRPKEPALNKAGDSAHTVNTDSTAGEEGSSPSDKDVSKTSETENQIGEIVVPTVIIEPPADKKTEEYDFGQPVQEREAVDDEYFRDAVFLGDSRTDGFRLYSGLNVPTYLCAKNISVVNIGTLEVISDGNGQYVSILSALGKKQYGKVYVMLGINEISLTPDAFALYYSKLIEDIQTIQPNAVIYLQTILPVSEEKENEHTCFNNENILIFNEVIAKLASEKKVFYVDTYSALADKNGFLPEDASYDGIHVIGSYCKDWCSYLRTHTVDTTYYFPPVPDSTENQQGVH